MPLSLSSALPRTFSLGFFAFLRFSTLSTYSFHVSSYTDSSWAHGPPPAFSNTLQNLARLPPSFSVRNSPLVPPPLLHRPAPASVLVSVARCGFRRIARAWVSLPSSSADVSTAPGPPPPHLLLAVFSFQPAIAVLLERRFLLLCLVLIRLPPSGD